MVTLKKVVMGQASGKGVWYVYGETIVMSCPECGAIGVLTDHKADSDGKVTPSVVCSRDGCGFHDYVKLEGWDA